jgi:hypothetical protein
VSAGVPKPVEVTSYAGHQGDQEPRSVVLRGERLSVVSIERLWREPDGDRFRVTLADGSRALLRVDLGGRWWLEESEAS